MKEFPAILEIIKSQVIIGMPFYTIEFIFNYGIIMMNPGISRILHGIIGCVAHLGYPGNEYIVSFIKTHS